MQAITWPVWVCVLCSMFLASRRRTPRVCLLSYQVHRACAEPGFSTDGVPEWQHPQSSFI